MNKTARTILMVVASSIASQIYVNMFVDGFIIAMSVVVMACFLYLFRDLNSVEACLLIAFFSPLVRLIVMLCKGGTFQHCLLLVVPDIAFFTAYAFFFGVVFRRLGYNTYQHFYLRLVLCDFLSNCVEMSTRFLIFNTFDAGKFLSLLFLALGRSFFILLICFASDTYKALLQKLEHEENYKKLVLMASTFNSEVYFMKKNMNEIENIMTDAFSLYRNLQENNYPQSYQSMALSIAKDIHEVKKGYRRVIQGIQENFLSDIESNPLSLHDIFIILEVDIKNSEEATRTNISFSYSYETNYMVEKHFPFMSILRNLISNSLDEFVKAPRFRNTINIKCQDVLIDTRQFCEIQVADNGPGIAEDFMEAIFIPGFSTKYSEETGDQNRGLGLSLVKDLLEDQFNGSISVESGKQGTIFTLQIPVSAFIIEDTSLLI